MALRYQVIGIAGTAKNTGKTTTTNFLLEQLKERGLVPGLTSIGYDGERLDNVTGLPKPRIPVDPGTVVAVACRCLPVSTAQVEVMEETDIGTPLGSVVLGKVTGAGQVVVAGPNKSSGLREVLEKLKKLGPDLILVDGALNRLAPMIETQGFILATGAARTADITRLAYETHSLNYLFNFPPASDNNRYSSVTLVTGEKRHQFNFSSIFTSGQLGEVIERLSVETQKIIIPGVVREELWKQLGKELMTAGISPVICVSDPIKLALAGSVGNLHRLFEELEEKGIRIEVNRPLPLLAITVNPFYPKYRFEVEDYEPAYIDAGQLLSAIRKVVTVPAVDVKQNGRDLMKVLL
ncbi:MAG: hypothetical protein H0Z35_02440 [Thermoanaerobacteraceae bacterium]|nr:hypothetical protein [Thermoanaerobacteraceae bacterium]